jgi:3',5'-cyclic AMP phosphodiesterase CpdA
MLGVLAMRIVQISDLHCGGGETFLKDKLQLAINEINTLKPDLVVINGDLTENGFKSEYEEAKRFIDQIIPPKVITSGNHDARYTGHLIFQELFGPPSSSLVMEDCVVFCANTARPDKDDGRIGVDQMDVLMKTLSNPKDKFKIVVMHHHPIPVPDTGLEQNIIEDAGDVLKCLSKLNVGLVLCGHRHRPWIWRLGPTTFVFAGAASTRKLRGFFENSYNIIEIEDGYINAMLKIVGGGSVSFEQIASGVMTK